MGDDDLRDVILRGASITIIGMFASKAFTFLFRTTIARFLGPDAYGLLNVGITAVGITSTISLLALHQALRNYIPKYVERGDKEGVRGIVLSTYQMTMPIAFLTAGILFLGSDVIASEIFGTPNAAEIIKVMSIAPIFSIIGSVGLSATRGHKIQKYHTFTRKFVQPFLQLIASVALVGLGMGLVGAGIGWVIGAAASAVLGVYFMERKVGPILRSNVKPRWQRKKALYYSVPLLMSSIMGSILSWTDTILLGQFLDEASIGLYNAAAPTAVLIMMPYQALKALLLPSMSESVEKGDDNLEEVLNTVTRWTFSVSFPFFCLLLIFPEEFIHLLFGNKYTSAGTALALLAIGNIYSASVGHLDTVIKAIDRSDIIFKNTLINTGVNLGLNLWMIPRYGIAGAALATTISTLLAQSILLGEVYYFKKIHPFSSYLIKPLTASIISLVIVYSTFKLLFTSAPWWILFPAGAVYGSIYLILVYLLGIKDEDKEFILKTLNRFLDRVEELR